ARRLQVAASSRWICSGVRPMSAAAMFSSRCATLDVPGMGSTTGEFSRSHARASWDGVPPGPSGTASRPVATGNQGDETNAHALAELEDILVLPLGDVVQVLDRCDRCDLAGALISGTETSGARAARQAARRGE